MLLTGNFIEILVEVNKWSTKIAGQLFTYNVTRKCFVDWDKQNKKLFTIRSIFLFFNTAAVLLRMLIMNFSTVNQTDKSKHITDMSFCVMMLFVCLVPAERYRVRGTFPEEFVTFFNQIIQVETIETQGKNPKNRKSRLYLVYLHLNFNFQQKLDLGHHIYQQRPKWQNTSSNFLCSCPNA